MKIFPKTFLYTLALLVLIAGLANLLVYTLMPAVYTNQKQANLTAHADQLAQQLGNAAREDIVELMGRFALPGQSNINIEVGGSKYSMMVWNSATVLDKSNSSTVTVIVDTVSDISLPSADTLVFDEERIQKGSVTSVTVFSESETYSADRIYTPSQIIREERSFTMEGEPGTVIVTMTLAPVKEAVGVILSLIPISIVLCIIVASLFSLLYTRAITHPIKVISNETRNMTMLKRDVRCRINSRDEFGELAANVNGLYENLLNTIDSLEAELKKVATSEKAKTDFLRAASHELKTPATAISVIMDNMILGVGKYKDYDEWLPKCKELMDNLSGRLHDILDASRLEDSSELSVTKGVEAFCSDVLEPYLLIARARELVLYIDWSAAFSLTAPQKLLGKALSCIFSNAVQYTAPGKQLRVYCRGRSLIVENECIPIPKEELLRLPEPFYRPDASRSRETGGNGLGLYIADTILRRLELEYHFESMTSPDGMRFTINF